MAKRKPTPPIKPFPDHIDRDTFGQWISGFTDGEGCFILRLDIFPGRRIPAAMFSIRLRADDKLALELIQSYWQCGHLYRNDKTDYDNSANRKSQWILQVNVTENLANILVPHFDRYPLFAKKRNDYLIWKKGVLLKYQVTKRPLTFGGKKGTHPKWQWEEVEYFASLVEAIRSQRTFKDNFPRPLPQPILHNPGLFDGLP